MGRPNRNRILVVGENMSESKEEIIKQHREIAERHWSFIQGLLDETVPIEKVHYLYVESWVHGVKHEIGATFPK